MSAPFNTLLLDLANWDLCIDSNGNIAMAGPPYSLAQDVASACRTLLGEVWYDSTVGVPWLQQILGQAPPLNLLQEYLVQAALTVPGVESATCVIESFNYATRTVTGQIQFVDTNGVSQSVSI